MTIKCKIEQINQELSPTSTQLLCVSKGRSLSEIEQAIAAGQLAFAENKVQEAVEKIIALNNPQLSWHFIGRIQKNKTRKIAEHFSWVDSVCDLHIATRLNAQRPKQLGKLNVCVQINIDDDPDKAGITAEQLPELLASLGQLNNIQVRGLMTVLRRDSNPEQQRTSFIAMQKLFQQYQEQYSLDTLSMGMSNSYQLAAQCGATIVRIGRTIFTETAV